VIDKRQREEGAAMETDDDGHITQSNEEATESTPETEASATTTEAPPVMHRDLGEWRGRDLIDRNGERIGKLEDVYFDVESDEPQFGTVKEGWIGRHLTFVPLVGVTIGPNSLQVAVSKEQVKSAPNIGVEGDELSPAEESALYHHYELNYTPPDRESGRRLARR
jgi:PRC-barrel domain protein